MKTKIIACPTNAKELETFSKFAINKFNSKSDIEVVFVLKPSKNDLVELFQNVKQQADFFSQILAKENDGIDEIIVLALNKIEEGSVLIIRSMENIENWDFILEMLEAHKKGAKIVLLKENNKSKFEKFLSDSADFIANNIIGVKLFEENIFVSLFDFELIKLAKMFPLKTNLILKTNSLFGYEKASIEEPSELFPKKSIFNIRKETISLLGFASIFVLSLIFQICFSIFSFDNTVFNIVFTILNFSLLICVLITYSIFCVKRKVGKLLL